MRTSGMLFGSVFYDITLRVFGREEMMKEGPRNTMQEQQNAADARIDDFKCTDDDILPPNKGPRRPASGALRKTKTEKKVSNSSKSRKRAKPRKSSNGSKNKPKQQERCINRVPPSVSDQVSNT